MDPRLPHDVLRLIIERATEQDLRTARVVRLVSRTVAAWAGPLACTLLVTARNQARIFDTSIDDTVRRQLAAHVVYLIMASDVEYIGHDGADKLFDLAFEVSSTSLLPPGDAAVSILAPFVHLKKTACWPSMFWALSRFPDFGPEQWFVLNPIVGTYDMSSLSLASLLRVHIVDYSARVISYARLYTSATHVYFEPLDAMDEEGILQFVAAVSALLALPTCQRLLLRVSASDTLPYAVRALAMLENTIEDSRIFVEDTYSYLRDFEQEALESSARWSCGVPLRERTFTTYREADIARSAI